MFVCKNGVVFVLFTNIYSINYSSALLNPFTQDKLEYLSRLRTSQLWTHWIKGKVYSLLIEQKSTPKFIARSPTVVAIFSLLWGIHKADCIVTLPFQLVLGSKVVNCSNHFICHPALSVCIGWKGVPVEQWISIMRGVVHWNPMWVSQINLPLKPVIFQDVMDGCNFFTEIWIWQASKPRNRNTENFLWYTFQTCQHFAVHFNGVVSQEGGVAEIYPRLQVLAMILENRLKFSKICGGWFPIYEVRIHTCHKSQFTLLFLFKSYFCFRFFGLWVIAVIRESFRQNLLYRMVWPSLRFVTGHIGWNTWLK